MSEHEPQSVIPVTADDRLHIQLHLDIALGALTLHAELDTWSPAAALVGPSGSGKSTVLRVLAGVESRASGFVRVGGETWQDSGTGVFMPPWERRVGWVPQNALLFPHLSVRENLGFSGASAAEVDEMAGRLFVSDLLNRRPRRLSGGEQQRVALGRAILSRPRLLLLDEPFTALDRPLRELVAGRVSAFCRESGVPLVLVSHDERDAKALAEEQWIVSGGRLRHV